MTFLAILHFTAVFVIRVKQEAQLANKQTRFETNKNKQKKTQAIKNNKSSAVDSLACWSWSTKLRYAGYG